MKSMLVPEVLACEVPETIGARVPVVATSVWVFDPEMAGADTVIDPEVSPEITKEAISVLSKDYPTRAGRYCYADSRCDVGRRNRL